MSFTPFVETDKPTMPAFNEKFQSAISEAVSSAISKDAKVVFGSYTGTGTESLSLTFESAPLAVFISSSSYLNVHSFPFIRQSDRGFYYQNTSMKVVSLSWSGNTITISDTGTPYLNKGTYYYAAILEPSGGEP